MLKAIMNMFAKGKGKVGGRKDRRQGKGKVMNYGGQGRGQGGHEKGDQGKGQIAAPQGWFIGLSQWTMRPWLRVAPQKEVPLAERRGVRVRSPWVRVAQKDVPSAERWGVRVRSD